MPRDNSPWVNENESQEETNARCFQENQSTSLVPLKKRKLDEQIVCSSNNQEPQAFDSLDNQILSQRILRKSDKLNKSEKVEKRSSCGRVIREPVRLEQERIEGIPKYTERQRARKLRKTLKKSMELTENLLKRMDKDREEEEERKGEEAIKKNDLGEGSSLNLANESDEEEENIFSVSDEEENSFIQQKLNNNLKPANDREFEGNPIPSDQPILVTNGIMKGYQLEGLKWLANLRKIGANGILGDEMGLGKTLQTISLFCHLYEVEKDPGPFLVVVPLSTIMNWESEVRRFAPSVPCHLLYPSHEAIKKWKLVHKREPCPELGGKKLGGIFLTTYDSLKSVARFGILDITWSFIVVDEGHRIKNRKCQLTIDLKKLKSTSRLLLTGTPLQNSLGELWALLNFLQPDIFDDCEIFETWFNVKSLHEDAAEKQRIVSQEQSKNILAQIHKIIAPFLLRRVKSEVDLEIPPKKEVIVYCPFTRVQAKQYSSIKQRLINAKKRNDKDDLGMGFYQMQYMHDLRSAVNHPYILNHPGVEAIQDNEAVHELVECCGKLQVLDQMLERLGRDGHKTLVFSQMTRMLDLLADYLDMRGMPYCSLDGRMEYLDRQKNIERFNREPEVKVFLLSTRAGGLGINLTAADTCIIYDSDWNPQQDLQAQDRCHRIGQTKPVMVYRLVTKKTIDQVMVERAQAKRALERLVVHKDKFKSGAKNLKNTVEGIKTNEIMRVLLSEDGLDTCDAEDKQRGLEQHQLDKIMDRTNMEG